MELLHVNIPNWSDLATHWRPEVMLVGTFLLALLGDLVVRGRRPAVPFTVALVGLTMAGICAVRKLGVEGGTVMGDLVVVDGLAAFFRILFIFTGLATVLFAWTSEEIMGKKRENKGEFFALTVLLTLAACVMAEARDLLMLFLSMEAVGIVSYVMAGYMRGSLRSTEASLKYVIFGAVSSAIMLYGLSLLYGMTGSMQFEGIRAGLQTGDVNAFGLLVAVVLVMAGMSYKIAAVPFHYWAPDVYEGAPTPVSALFSVGPKAAGFALMIRFFYTTLAAGPDANASAGLIAQINWPLLMAVISAATMTYGNLVALRQANVKRMLAYSSIAHVGYLLMGFVLLTDAGLQAILFYLLVYTFMNLGAFFFVVAVNNHLKSEHLDDWVGLGFRMPWAASLMIIFLGSLTGIPPFAGFAAKLYLFTAVMDRQWFWLVIVAGLNSVISLYYYFKVAKAMFLMSPPEGADMSPLKLHWLQYTVLGVLAIPTLALGLFFGRFKGLADRAIEMMTTGL
ncbi:MAG: NADH-quinone oxidoreductase subunit N [bacterium]|nr:NADH-quinone oxidoreductase subunit N [bacterium]